jgi:hypothetical protein
MLNTNNSRKETYDNVGGLTEYTFDFKVYNANDLRCFVTPDGQTANDGTDAVEILGVDFAPDPADGGTITIAPTTLNDLVTIISDIPTSRTTNYVDNGDFLEDTLDDDIDRNVSLIKQQQDNNRGLQFPKSLQDVDDVIVEKLVPGSLLIVSPDGKKLQSYAIPTTDTGFITNVSGDGVTENGDAREIESVVTHEGHNLKGSTNSLHIPDFVSLTNDPSSAPNILESKIIGYGKMPPELADWEGIIFSVFVASVNANTTTTPTLEILESTGSDYVIKESDVSACPVGRLNGYVLLRFHFNAGDSWWRVLYAEKFPIIPDEFISEDMLGDEVVGFGNIQDYAVQAKHLSPSGVEALNVQNRVIKSWGKITDGVEADFFNVAGMSRPDDGQIYITFASPMANAHYVVIPSGTKTSGASPTDDETVTTNFHTTAGFFIFTRDAGAYVDFDEVNFMVIGEKAL